MRWRSFFPLFLVPCILKTNSKRFFSSLKRLSRHHKNSFLLQLFPFPILLCIYFWMSVVIYVTFLNTLSCDLYYYYFRKVKESFFWHETVAIYVVVVIFKVKLSIFGDSWRFCHDMFCISEVRGANLNLKLLLNINFAISLSFPTSDEHRPMFLSLIIK